MVAGDITGGDKTGGDNMAKQLRNFIEGNIYHIVQRGNNHAYIFNDQLDKTMLMEKIRETLERYSCIFLYYSLMDNHYHLVFEMMQTDLSKIMHRINLSYSKYYNKKYNRCGTIFGQRYAAYQVKGGSHFHALLLYIAYNPVKANMVRHPAHYQWCAHLDIVSKRQSIVDKKYLLSRFHRSYDKALNIYTQLIEGKQNQPVQWDNPQDIISEIRRQTLEVCFQEKIDDQVMENRILNGGRCPDTIKLKKDFVRAVHVQGFSVSEIARFLSITERAVRYHLN